MSTLFAYAEGEKSGCTCRSFCPCSAWRRGLRRFTACTQCCVCSWRERLRQRNYKVVPAGAAGLCRQNSALQPVDRRVARDGLHDLEALRLRLADRFLHAPLGDVENHSIGEIKSMMVDKIENLEPPLAHMIPEGAGHIVLPVVSILALLCIDWRLALASLVTFPLFSAWGLRSRSAARVFQSTTDLQAT